MQIRCKFATNGTDYEVAKKRVTTSLPKKVIMCDNLSPEMIFFVQNVYDITVYVKIFIT